MRCGMIDSSSFVVNDAAVDVKALVLVSVKFGAAFFVVAIVDVVFSVVARIEFFVVVTVAVPIRVPPAVKSSAGLREVSKLGKQATPTFDSNGAVDGLTCQPIDTALPPRSSSSIEASVALLSENSDSSKMRFQRHFLQAAAERVLWLHLLLIGFIL